jgi:hypothetical protein
MKYARLFVDDAGETHFDDVEVDEAEISFAPPAPPLFASEPISTARTLFTRFPTGWSGDWHPAPTRQFGIILDGALEITASDGERRTFETGSVRLLEDTSGKGHRTRVVGDREVLSVAIQLE